MTSEHQPSKPLAQSDDASGIGRDPALAGKLPANPYDAGIGGLPELAAAERAWLRRLDLGGGQ
jgi:hypothetical protein